MVPTERILEDTYYAKIGGLCEALTLIKAQIMHHATDAAIALHLQDHDPTLGSIDLYCGALCAVGQKLQAIQIYRSVKAMGLVETKKYLEAVAFTLVTTNEAFCREVGIDYQGERDE